VSALPVVTEIARMKEIPVDEAETNIKMIMDRVSLSFKEWGVN
jgi:hypothetical protein